MIHSGYLLLGYHSKPTLFQVNTIVAVDGISFPDITICNQNRVKGSRMLSEYLFLLHLVFSHFLISKYDYFKKRTPKISNSKLNKRQFLSGSSYGWQFVLDGNNELGGRSLHNNMDVGSLNRIIRFCKDYRISNEFSMSFLQYTATHCEWNCVAREWLSTCGCVLMKHNALNVSANVSVCQPYDIQRCSGKVNGNIFANISACNCDVECRLMEYDAHISYSDVLPSSLRQRFSFSELYLKSIAYERHEQQKQLQTADLLSSIAGSMGLFLGMSTITLLEIFIYLFKSVWGMVNTERQKQFMDAMMEEENERRQSVVIEAPANDDDSKSGKSATHIRRVSVAPLHIRLDRSGSIAVSSEFGKTTSTASFKLLYFI
ncbi:unnamed protein product [Angiostrongylus costaricensis]|uniref:Amiloride-sensitive sodium channel n=1 Tax=Angiostrongylus costaricensis TaxID=334426 RepID=A0A0R3Q046_ANGCS|nr:unnamed protein product [Angiostrongylus costaricensis]